jgi:putative transposase
MTAWEGEAPAEPEQPPEFPLAKPESGFYHVVRFVRSDGIFNLFGEKFPMPPEAAHEYIWGTVDVSRQRVSFHLDAMVIDERGYRLR